MRIAFFLGKFPVRSETFIARQARGLLAAGHDVRIISLVASDEWTNGDDRMLFKDRITVLPYAVRDITIKSVLRVIFGGLAGARGRQRLPLLGRALLSKQASAIKQIIASGSTDLGRFDAVLAHFGPNGVRALSARESGVFSGPIGTVFHGFDMSIKNVIAANLEGYKRLFVDGDMMYPISYAWRARLISWGCAPSKISVMRMGVDLANYASIPSRVVEHGHTLRVVTVGRLVEKKGTCDAIKSVLQSSFPVELRIIGTGPLDAHLKSVAGTSARIKFLGAMDHAEVLKEVAAADVFLLPSVVAESGDMEGIPVSIMEAMALGTLVVATHHSGNSELIEDKVSGWLVPERQPNAIAAALKAIYFEQHDLDRIRMAARTKIAAEFDNSVLDLALVHQLAEMGRAYKA